MREFRQLSDRCRPRIADQSAAVVLGDQPRRTHGERPPPRRAAADPRSTQRRRVRPDRRRTSSAGRKLAGCATIPARVLDLDDAAADEATIIENLHREDIHPLDEGESYQRLVASGRTIEDVAVAIGKSKGYVYQRISLTRLVPKVQDLLARDVLPLIYALKIAVVPAEQQEEALAQCFRPLFRDEEARRDQLEPLAQLTAWVEKTVRLNPRSEDATCSCRRWRSKSSRPSRSATHRCSRSRRCTSTPTRPIRSRSSPRAGSRRTARHRCQHARPGVIVLGRRAGHVPAGLHRQEGVREALGTSEAQCRRHRRRTGRADAEARQQQEEAWAKQRADTERWRTELRPRAVRLIAERTAKLRMVADAAATPARGHPARRAVPRRARASLRHLPVKRYPQAIAVALALRHSWQRDDLITFSKRLGVKVTSKDLADTPTPSAPDPKPPQGVVGPAAQDAEHAHSARHSTRRSRTHPWAACRVDDEIDVHAATSRVRASRIGFSGSPRRRQGSSLRFDPPARGCGLDERLGRASEGNYVMPGRFCPAAKAIESVCFKENHHVRHIDHAQHRSDDRSADAPLPRVHHDCACRPRRTVDAHALRRSAQGRRGLCRGHRRARRDQGSARRRGSSSSTPRNSGGSARAAARERIDSRRPIRSWSASTPCSSGSGSDCRSRSRQRTHERQQLQQHHIARTRRSADHDDDHDSDSQDERSLRPWQAGRRGDPLHRR